MEGDGEMSSTAILLITLFGLILINVPISVSLGLASAFTLMTQGFPTLSA